MSVATTAQRAVPLSPAGCLSLLWPAVPEAIVAPPERGWMSALAATLPGVPRTAIEFRLGGGGRGADFHLYLSPDDADAAIVEQHLAQAGGAARFDSATARFLLDWARNAGGLRDAAGGLYLEWDRPSGGAPPAAPAIFLPLEGRSGDGLDPARRASVLAHAEALRPGGGETLAAAIARVGAVLPRGASVSFVGFMIGRGRAVRLNLRGLRPADLGPLLGAIGWPGDKERASATFAALVERADRVAVAIDLAPDVGGTIGFETVLDAMPRSEPRWVGLLNHLEAMDLCTASERVALLAMPAALEPEQAQVEWPSSWLMAAAIAPPHLLPWVDRRISHLKLVLPPDAPAHAKAYVSAQHAWRRGTAPALPPQVAAAGIEQARAAAVRFLLAERAQDGFWRDFLLPNGPSDEWVTAFVGLVLVRGGGQWVPRELVDETAAALMARQRSGGGWGYNGHSPADADSSAWALKFLAAAGWRGAAFDSGMAFLRGHADARGCTTYAPTTSVRFEGGMPRGGDGGWRQPHACVAANAAPLLDGALDAPLLAAQARDGIWPAYWWQTDVYATALAAEAVAAVPGGEAAASRARRWARSVASAGSAFDRAWTLQLLARGDEGDREAARALARGLMSEQLRDGSWAPGAAMLFPPPGATERDPGAAPVLDARRVYTTASVLLALTCAAHLESIAP